MSARSDLADLIEPDMPDTWEMHPAPTRLRSFTDPHKTVAVVIEQRSIASGTTSTDDNGIPVAVELLVWVVVDGARGNGVGDIEDALEDAAEQMIRQLESLPQHVWDGSATRENYDDQKPAYQFTIRAAGRLTL